MKKYEIGCKIKSASEKTGKSLWKYLIKVLKRGIMSKIN